jgi:N-acetylneuraminic acid mutarotase
MKKVYYLIIYFFAVNSFSLQAQYGWTQKASLTPFGGRESATGFSIGHYGFIGTGITTSGFVNDFWRWNQDSNTWTQIASYAGAGRYGVTGFTIGGNGYCCFGYTGSTLATDLWEYDTATNTWTQKANFPGAARYGAFAFVLGTKAYIGTGEPNGSPCYQDVWIYDALADTWTQVADFGGGVRTGACAFSLNGHGYAGCGANDEGTTYSDMYQYDTATNTWTNIASVPGGGGGNSPTAFVIDSLAYVGLGNTSSYDRSFWSYSPATNIWTSIAPLPGVSRSGAVGFNIGNYGYAGTGHDSVNDYLPDYWQYGPTVATLSIIANVTSNVSCNGGNNGSQTVTVSGGVIPYSYSWNPGGQSTATVTGLPAGTYTITVTDNSGTTNSAIVIITQPPVITITSGSSADNGRCNGSAWVNVSGGVLPYTYSWNTGGNTTDSITNLCNGTYCCIITDNNGCSQTTCITINSCTNTYVEPVCMVTVDTATSKCEVVWGRTNSPPNNGSYNIYRDISSVFTLIHNQPLDSLTKYIDNASNPSDGPVSYELSTVDSCCESSLCSPHSTVHLAITAGPNVYVLSWTPYVGFTPSEYDIFRGPSMSSLSLIGSVSNSVLTYHDTLPPSNSVYLLEAIYPGACNPTSHKPDTHLSQEFDGSFSNGFYTQSLGVQSIEASSFDLKIYPNPSNGIFNLTYSNLSTENAQFIITDVLGRTISEFTLQGNQNKMNIDASQLASGIYFYRVNSKQGLLTSGKIVIER